MPCPNFHAEGQGYNDTTVAKSYLKGCIFEVGRCISRACPAEKAKVLSEAQNHDIFVAKSEVCPISD